MRLVSAEAAFWSARIAFTLRPESACAQSRQGNPSGAPGPTGIDGEARAAERVQPLRARVIAHMGMVAQQLDRLQMRVERAPGLARRRRRTPLVPAFQYAARFAKPGVEVAPVMGGESAGDEVERSSSNGRCSAGASTVSMLPKPFSRAVRATAASISDDKSLAIPPRVARER